MAYFPLFINLENKPCLVVGGGKVAIHKAQVLLDFGAEVLIISHVIIKEIKQMKKVTVMEREFMPEDTKGKALVVAATDDAAENHRIAELCKKQGILVNAVDRIEDCGFIFPSYVRQKDVVAAFSSSGKSPVLTQYLKARENEILTPQIGNLNDLLGSLRSRAKQLFFTEEERKCFYQEILKLWLLKKSLPTDEEIEALLKEHQSFESSGRREEEENGADEKTKKQ